jgi:large subunit ribosomal protein L4
MAKVQVIDMSGTATGEIELNDSIFGIEINENAVREVIKNYLANQRQGTQSAKTRSEVRGGGKKPFRQKGTGRARQGSIVAPNHVGGGIVFAPKPRDYRYNIPKKVKRLALKSALSSKVVESEIIVLDSLSFEAPKTKDMIKVLQSVGAAKKALIVMAEKDDNVIRSAHNIPGIRTCLVSTMNVYDIINHTSFIVTKDAVGKIEEVYA